MNKYWKDENWMALYKSYVNRTEFKDYDDLKQNLEIVPDNFNTNVLDVGKNKPGWQGACLCNHKAMKNFYLQEMQG